MNIPIIRVTAPLKLDVESNIHYWIVVLVWYIDIVVIVVKETLGEAVFDLTQTSKLILNLYASCPFPCQKDPDFADAN